METPIKIEIDPLDIKMEDGDTNAFYDDNLEDVSGVECKGGNGIDRHFCTPELMTQFGLCVNCLTKKTKKRPIKDKLKNKKLKTLDVVKDNIENAMKQVLFPWEVQVLESILSPNLNGEELYSELRGISMSKFQKNWRAKFRSVVNDLQELYTAYGFSAVLIGFQPKGDSYEVVGAKSVLSALEASEDVDSKWHLARDIIEQKLCQTYPKERKNPSPLQSEIASKLLGALKGFKSLQKPQANFLLSNTQKQNFDTKIKKAQDINEIVDEVLSNYDYEEGEEEGSQESVEDVMEDDELCDPQFNPTLGKVSKIPNISATTREDQLSTFDENKPKSLLFEEFVNNSPKTELLHTSETVDLKNNSSYSLLTGENNVEIVMKDQFLCDKCNKQYRTIEVLKKHIQRKHTSRCFLCDQCDKKYSDSDSLKRHILSVHEGVLLSCDLCDNKQFKTRNALRIHKKSVHEGIRYPCNQCDYIGTRKSCLIRHIEFHHTIQIAPKKKLEKTISCEKCEKKFRTNSQFNRHYKVNHEGVRFSCELCSNKPFYSKSMLKIHKESVHDGIFYLCDQCNYKASTMVNLKQHKASTHEGVRYTCDQCNTSPFTAKRSLDRHKASAHEHSGMLVSSITQSFSSSSNELLSENNSS